MDLLVRGITCKLQERAYGGFSPAIVRRLRSLVDTPDKGTTPSAPAGTLRPGTLLVREWRGRAHRVIVIKDRFDYEGERYRSLSEIAGRITGSHRSGPLFFGLKRRRPSPTPPKADNE